MQILGDGSGHSNLLGVARMAIRRDYDWPGRRVLGNFGHHKIIRADYHRCFYFTEADSGTPQFVRPQAAAENPHFASRQGCSRRDRLNTRLAIHVFLSQETIGQGHQMLPLRSDYRRKPKCNNNCMTASARMPAATSSATIPVPSGSFSSCRTGGGFTISKPRKSIKPTAAVFHVTGASSRVIHCPATS